MHECPRCGQQTDGSWSEGGLKWAICEDCMTLDSISASSMRHVLKGIAEILESDKE